MLIMDGIIFVLILEISARELIDGFMSSWWDWRTVLKPSVVVVICAALGTEKSRSGLM